MYVSMYMVVFGGPQNKVINMLLVMICYDYFPSIEKNKGLKD
jgi:hypothetical protein